MDYSGHEWYDVIKKKIMSNQERKCPTPKLNDINTQSTKIQSHSKKVHKCNFVISQLKVTRRPLTYDLRLTPVASGPARPEAFAVQGQLLELLSDFLELCGRDKPRPPPRLQNEGVWQQGTHSDLQGNQDFHTLISPKLNTPTLT